MASFVSSVQSSHFSVVQSRLNICRSISRQHIHRKVVARAVGIPRQVLQKRLALQLSQLLQCPTRPSTAATSFASSKLHLLPSYRRHCLLQLHSKIRSKCNWLRSCKLLLLLQAQSSSLQQSLHHGCKQPNRSDTYKATTS